MKGALPKLFALGFPLMALDTPAATHYVAVNSTNPVSPYLDWATAATVIQDAIGVAQSGEIVLVTNGVYDVGGVTYPTFGAATNRVALTNAITVRSVNGPQSCVIKGRAAAGPGERSTRCAAVLSNAVLSGFTLTNGQSGGVRAQDGGVITNCIITGCEGGSGGGVYGGTLYDCYLALNTTVTVTGTGGGGAYHSILHRCVLSNNLAQGTSAPGGGAWGCTVYNSLLVGNRAVDGAGAAQSTLYNCTVSSNTAANQGGGLYSCDAFNSIIYFNSAPYVRDMEFGSRYYCCVPGALSGGSITNDPRFVNAAAGDFRLMYDSPCINAGSNAYLTNGPDLDGHLRVVADTVDIGAYEFQTPSSRISYAWLQQYGFPTDGSADVADPDQDRMNNWQEWIAGTSPTNAASALRLLTPTLTTSNVAVRWQSVNNRTYFLERTDIAGPASAFLSLASNLPGTFGTTVYYDTNRPATGLSFYRVGVQ